MRRRRGQRRSGAALQERALPGCDPDHAIDVVLGMELV
ncbi:hypothetical protein MM2B1231_4863 [Mycobacteroides abscessus subsp. bolletii 2B-1231]|uniref:Uncharacterized protein n=1 Tax=Mycobacteroides abscessus MAB_091912_2446 TaxID=1335414 RepID=A0A829MA86_9MYCO|nr:hypothetical protein MM1S1520914_0247 [Mycobacteroides abscessus subsp. bolletii 1S-152-0914]EIU79170.1 hypothetical protein MM2B0626_4799 [Mycobacteroides abscessus subsp. bolletii 2B-0626]EIV17065.1 hypothetical protein MM2B0912R_0249 [Mycobacteroides abscessus subsp. bolletii 2B-0912-R]EIV19294.1 hypothetical protein MM2B0912S_4803 [Mycobacteroides abscessus subsp. bolletii 2B-0912-S]EIV72549.1 hypothetical protein MM2B1231_4863 [Mycobacteroides abscessus subsp. bolletii 2B-1231]EIV73926